MEDYLWVEVIAALTVPVALIALIMTVANKEEATSGRAIQFLALGTALPIVLILALERIIEPGTIGALLGGILGYVFSSSGHVTNRP